MAETVIHPEIENRPNVFTQAEIGWTPWLEPLAEADLTERHWAGLVDASRSKSPYFMLLARDPEILQARTKTDKDIFYNVAAGLPRADRELAATAASRTNGCIFCASVHSRFASHHSKRTEDVQRLLDEGTETDLGSRWNVLVSTSSTLTETPAAFEAADIGKLRDEGLSDLEIADLIHAAAFFNWANRLMLSLGEPTPAK
ncbi:alkylhydroperoxidase domain protein [Rhizobium sp. ICMP 5592]|uniref:alkylhydroperoxidase domain protein n=1 Tax=Rhizobium sp. ICMP 5592 TaxID=2292445 RepID=UPI0012973270|nr:alkylhydroperoxidase domain protein [Rhizobium sp. ICMP 5592]MQB41093.1 alkylhydroperoxidase domain protein [Rhizobium sp. ICMP 5592]